MYFPLFLKTNKIKFLVIGAGSIALAKLETLIEFSENILVVAKKSSKGVEDLAKNGQIELVLSEYNSKYLDGVAVVIAATNDEVINQIIAQDARKAKKLVNVVDEPDNCDFIFGATIKRGNVTVAASSSGVSPVLSRVIKQKLNKLLPENFEFLSEFLTKNRDFVKKKLTDLQARRLFWQDAIEGVIGDEILLGNDKKAQELLENALKNTKNQQKGAVYFIGAGPGDPELITIKAVNLLSRADVVLYDRLVSKDIVEYARRDALKINVGKTRNLHLVKQEEINQMIKKYANEGKIVARLKGGDTSFFAHLSEEIDEIIEDNIPYQVIPGITAASGAAAYSGIPLTSRNSNKSVRFVTIYKENIEDLDYFKELANSNDTLVLYMSSHNLSLIANNLVKFGKDKNTPIAVIEQATTPYQKSYIAKISEFEEKFGEKKFTSPSLAIIGDVIDLENKYQWREEDLEGIYFEKLEK